MNAQRPTSLAAAERPLILGVLNVTPDSFSDGGRFLAVDAAIARGLELVRDGADIIDIGGESTRPGAAAVDAREERERVLPVVEALAQQGVAVSIDTIHAETARAAIAAGAAIVNDVSGGEHDERMRATIADTGARFIAMHWRGVPDPGHGKSNYSDVVTEVRDKLGRLADAALAAGIAADRIVLDPGFGFDKTTAQGWELLAGLPRLAELGYPLLIGVSRKRMIADTLRARSPRDVTMSDRDVATAVVGALATASASVSTAQLWGVRVHEVIPTFHALTVVDAWMTAAESDGTDEPTRVDDRSPSRSASRGVPEQETPRDRIALRGLEVFAHHGVFAFEREGGQRFIVDAELAVDLAPAAAGDALARTVHYGELAEAIVAAVGRDPVDLIETVAERVADVALGFAGVVEATITIHKPDAPIDADFADVAVTVVRRPGGGPR